MESFEDPLAKLRALAEKSVELEKTETKSISIGRMEEFRDSLKSFSFYEGVILGKFIDYAGRMENASDYKKVRASDGKMDRLHGLAEEENLVQDFLNAKDNLDSNSKRKLWEKIYKEDWLPKLEETAGILQKEIEILENLKIGKNESFETDNVSQTLAISEFIKGTKRDQLDSIKKCLLSLDQFGFDEQRLKELEERFKKVKK